MAHAGTESDGLQEALAQKVVDRKGLEEVARMLQEAGADLLAGHSVPQVPERVFDLPEKPRLDEPDLDDDDF